MAELVDRRAFLMLLAMAGLDAAAGALTRNVCCARKHTQGESPECFLGVKQRPGRASGAGVHTRDAYESVSRHKHRGRNTVLRFWPTLKGFQVAWLLVGAPSGLRLRGKEPEGANDRVRAGNPATGSRTRRDVR